uniref:Uncharacterized protein n=1 Tax=Arundo donax TaxID=35708 RepID=A0A0A9HT15_ARUDO
MVRCFNHSFYTFSSTTFILGPFKVFLRSLWSPQCVHCSKNC